MNRFNLLQARLKKMTRLRMSCEIVETFDRYINNIQERKGASGEGPKARSKRRSTHVPNQTQYGSTLERFWSDG